MGCEVLVFGRGEEGGVGGGEGEDVEGVGVDLEGIYQLRHVLIPKSKENVGEEKFDRRTFFILALKKLLTRNLNRSSSV